MFNHSTLCVNWACCLVSRKICWNVFFHGLFICTGLDLFQASSSGIYLTGKPVTFIKSVIFFFGVGGHWNTIYLSASNFICVYHISNDRFLLVSSEILLVLLHHILHIFVLCVSGNADNIDKRKSRSSFCIVNCSLHHIQSLFWIPHARTGKCSGCPKFSFELFSICWEYESTSIIRVLL